MRLSRESLRINASTLARFSYLFIVVVTALVAFTSCVFLLSQAVRTAPNRSWTRNVNAVVIGGAYILILVISLVFCLNRRLSVRLRLARIPKGRVATGKGDLPKAVHYFIEGEFLRACAIAYAAHPKVTHRDGWGRPGTKYENVRFRTAILDTIPVIDGAARSVIPSMPPLSPHVPISKHFRHIVPLLSVSLESDTDSSSTMDGKEAFARYTTAVEKAKYASSELEEDEFASAMEAAEAIRGILEAYKRVLDERIPGSAN